MDVIRTIFCLIALSDVIGMFRGALMVIEAGAKDDEVRLTAAVLTACISGACGVVAASIAAALSPS